MALELQVDNTSLPQIVETNSVIVFAGNSFIENILVIWMYAGFMLEFFLQVCNTIRSFQNNRDPFTAELPLSSWNSCGRLNQNCNLALQKGVYYR